MARRCAIIAADVLTALGAGTDAVWAEMLRGACGLRPMRRFPHGRYMTDFAAEVEATSATDDNRAWTMAVETGRRMLGRLGPRAGHTEPATGRAGLVLATTKAEIGQLERLASGAEAGKRHNPGVLARDLAAELGLGGPVMSVSNACASGLIAIVQAAQLLRRGDAKAMAVIGVDALADFTLAGFSALNALSKGGPCRPYDAERDGLSLGEGAGALFLVAEPQPGDDVLGEVIGWGITNDACHITAPSRTGHGLQAAIERALAAAGLAPRDIHYINGHGTATVYNDAMEAKAVHRVFGPEMPPLTSMKGYFGHTLGAAGAIEAALSLVSLRERVVPGCLGLRTLGVDVPIRVPIEPLSLPRLSNVLSFKCGFGGVNAAVVLAREGGARNAEHRSQDVMRDA